MDAIVAFLMGAFVGVLVTYGSLRRRARDNGGSAGGGGGRGSDDSHQVQH